MSNIECKIKENARREERSRLLTAYAIQLQNFDGALIRRKSQGDATAANPQEKIILEQAESLKAYFQAYQATLTSPDYIQKTDEQCQQIITTILLTQQLLDANGDNTQTASNNLLDYVSKALVPNPSWSQQIGGIALICLGIIIAAISLMLGISVISLIPEFTVFIAAVIWAGFMVGMIWGMGALFGVGLCNAGVNVFMDSDPDRDAIRTKVTDFCNAFLTEPNPNISSQLELESTGAQRFCPIG